MPSGILPGRIFEPLLIWLAFLLAISFTSNAAADGLLDSIGISYQYASIELDKSGALSTEDTSHAFKLFASKTLHRYINLEYGYQSLGTFSADYDFTVGNFRFVESQTLDLEQNLFTGLSVGDYISWSSLPDGHGIRPKVLLGLLLWNADVQTNGELYDTGVSQGNYNVSGSDYGLSHYLGAGIEYDFGGDLLLSIDVVVNVNVGADLEMVDDNGSTQQFVGKDVLVGSIGMIYRF
jgi:hypothetical protein